MSKSLRSDRTGPSLHRPHPWHGLAIGPEPPRIVDAYVEITPFDLMKYEVDKENGYLRISRPQRGASTPPAPYGFIPRTYCAERVASLCPGTTRGDGDPLDVCVLSERPVARNEILMHARVVGGLQTVDGGEADDKVIAVLHEDRYYEGVEDLRDLSPVVVERLEHYFGNYKRTPGGRSPVAVRKVYGRRHAWKVVSAAAADYEAHFGG